MRSSSSLRACSVGVLDAPTVAVYVRTCVLCVCLCVSSVKFAASLSVASPSISALPVPFSPFSSFLLAVLLFFSSNAIFFFTFLINLERDPSVS